MQLREAKTLGVFNRHDRGFGHIHADFDDGRRDKDLRVAALERRHGSVLVGALHLAVNEPDLVAKKLPQHFGALSCCGDVEVFVFIDQRTHPVDAGAVADGAANAVDHFVNALQRNGARVYGRAARRLFAQDRHVHVAEICQHERARDGRGCHDQYINGGAFFTQRQTLMHAKAMLFVDNGEPEIGERDAFLKKRMGADNDVDIPGGKSG